MSKRRNTKEELAVPHEHDETKAEEKLNRKLIAEKKKAVAKEIASVPATPDEATSSPEVIILKGRQGQRTVGKKINTSEVKKIVEAAVIERDEKTSRPIILTHGSAFEEEFEKALKEQIGDVKVALPAEHDPRDPAAAIIPELAERYKNAMLRSIPEGRTPAYQHSQVVDPVRRARRRAKQLVEENQRNNAPAAEIKKAKDFLKFTFSKDGRQFLLDVYNEGRNKSRKGAE